MAQESYCDIPWTAAPQDMAVENAQPTGLHRERFFVQLANALTTLNGLVYLTHRTASRVYQQRYIEAMQDTMGGITQSMQRYRLTRDGHPLE